MGIRENYRPGCTEESSSLPPKSTALSLLLTQKLFGLFPAGPVPSDSVSVSEVDRVRLAIAWYLKARNRR